MAVRSSLPHQVGQPRPGRILNPPALVILPNLAPGPLREYRQPQREEQVLNRTHVNWSPVLLAVTVAACGGSSESPSSPSPTAPSPSGTCSPAVVTVCAVAGAPSDGRTAIGQVTVSSGGAPSCRVAVHEAISISFTIVNPNSSARWEIRQNNTHISSSPTSGSAGSAGPFQATVQFTTFGGDNVTEDTVSMTTSDQLGCEVRVYGHK